MKSKLFAVASVASLMLLAACNDSENMAETQDPTITEGAGQQTATGAPDATVMPPADTAQSSDVETDDMATGSVTDDTIPPPASEPGATLPEDADDTATPPATGTAPQ